MQSSNPSIKRSGENPIVPPLWGHWSFPQRNLVGFDAQAVGNQFYARHVVYKVGY